MKIQELIDKYLTINKKLYQEANNPLRSHGPDHHYRVCMNALRLTKGFAADNEVLIIAALLHDLAAYYPDESKEDYHDYDYLKAKEILDKQDLDDEKKNKILEVIAKHGSDQKYNRKKEDIEVTILRDADKLEAFGPLGVARIIMVRTLRGDILEDIAEDFYTDGHLQKKWSSITTDRARELAKEDYKYAMKFFKRLSKDLSSDLDNKCL